MAGRITVSAGTAPVVLTGLDATNATAAYMDEGLTSRVLLPRTVAAGSALVVYCADSGSVTPTVTAVDGTVVSAVVAACRAGLPVVLGPFVFDTAGSIPKTSLAAPVQVSLDKADTAAQKASNLTDLASASSARTALGLGSAAVMTPTSIAADSALTGTYGRPSGNRYVSWGDSTIAGGSSGSLFGNCAATFAAMLSGQRLNLVANAGVPGNTSAQAIVRFATDVAPYGPHIVDIGVGTNDIGTGVTLATFQGNISTMVGACRSIGAVPVIRTIVPNNTYSHTTINRWNAWLHRYASQQRLPLLDAYSVLVDPTNGNYLSTLGDGTHPNAAGHLALGSMYSTNLAPLLRPWSPYMSGENTDAAALWTTNNLLLTDTNSDGVPDGWTAYSGSSGFTHALVIDSAVPGKMMQITMTGAAATRVLERTVSGGISTGDVLSISAVVTADGGVDSELKLAFTGGSGSARTYIHPAAATTRGVYYMERTVPAGATGIVVDCIAGAGTGVCAWGRVTVLNLTTGAIL